MGFYSSVAVTKEMREASKNFDKAQSDFSTELWLRDDFYKAVKDYLKEAKKDGSFDKLD